MPGYHPAKQWQPNRKQPLFHLFYISEAHKRSLYSPPHQYLHNGGNLSASYLQTNFNAIDKDGDGVIGSDEITNFTNMLSSKGISKTELTQLAANGASGLSSDTINNILEHFDEMDTNHDGRVTSAEISAYSYGASRQEKMDEFNHKRATEMSTFYGSDSSSTDTGSYSMLSYKYKNYNQSN